MLNNTPKTATEVTFLVHEPKDFAPALNKWIDTLKGISSRKELEQRVRDAPPLLRSRLKDGGYCDAYLAAYVDWICQAVKLKPPTWVEQSIRVAETAFIDDEIDLSETPNEFRQRNIFTVPENVIQLRRGRPSKSTAHKLANNAERQRRYRQRVKEKLQRLEALERAINS